MATRRFSDRSAQNEPNRSPWVQHVWRQPREIPRDGSVRQPASEFQEVRDLVVESLRLFDEDHMARVAHDHL
ncbi:MAG TPA: hypothetical protein VKF16_11600, partial [Candidatus Dormibacteraeota bacterium]|nr:hypothetical protein [Candidatus Dormibacteraeota bacterium]